MIAEATARIKRLVASEKFKVVANLVTALVKRNAVTRASTNTLERNIAVLDRAWFEVEATFDALRLHHSNNDQTVKNNK